jgi:hypothetical protein
MSHVTNKAEVAQVLIRTLLIELLYETKIDNENPV